MSFFVGAAFSKVAHCTSSSHSMGWREGAPCQMGRMRKSLFLVLTLLTAAQVEADSFWMNKQETDDLRLLYFDPQTTYLLPHVTRSYQNSLEFQRYIFDWTPYEKTTLMLQDFSDYGNAAALASPTNVLCSDLPIRRISSRDVGSSTPPARRARPRPPLRPAAPTRAWASCSEKNDASTIA